MPDQSMPEESAGNLYDDQPAAAAPPAEAEKPEAPAEESKPTTAVLQKSILAGKEFKPGDEVILKIVAMHDGEVEVAYATGEEKSESGAEKSDYE